MAKLEVTKSIEARKLNKRTRQALAEPPVTIPYGAILSDIVQNQDVIEFVYLNELFGCKSEALRAASTPLEGPAGTASPSGSSSRAAAAPAFAQEPVTFVWEKLRAGAHPTFRAKLPGGWLVATGESAARGIAFYPDPEHAWDGATL